MARDRRIAAVADQPLHQVGRNVFPERGQPLRHVADRTGEVFDLGQSGRMVGIITHVRELANRVPVRFEVRKGPRSSVVEKQFA